MTHIIELGESDLARAEACGAARCDDMNAYLESRGRKPDDPAHWLARHVMEAQCELAVAKALGARASLSPKVFRNEPDIEPCWCVKGVLANSKYNQLRLRRRDWHPGWRFVLVRRHTAVFGGYVFEIVGWIDDHEAREVGRPFNDFDRSRITVRDRHLKPLEYKMLPTYREVVYDVC